MHAEVDSAWCKARAVVTSIEIVCDNVCDLVGQDDPSAKRARDLVDRAIVMTGEFGPNGNSLKSDVAAVRLWGIELIYHKITRIETELELCSDSSSEDDGDGTPGDIMWGYGYDAGVIAKQMGPIRDTVCKLCAPGSPRCHQANELVSIVATLTEWLVDAANGWVSNRTFAKSAANFNSVELAQIAIKRLVVNAQSRKN